MVIINYIIIDNKSYVRSFFLLILNLKKRLIFVPKSSDIQQKVNIDNVVFIKIVLDLVNNGTSYSIFSLLAIP